LVDNNTTATHLFRIAQEALNNALRHSRARQINLYLTKLDEHQISLEICDDGVGIEPCHGDSDQSQTGIGLRTMDYRARIIGGWLQIERRSNGGTVVRCVIPDARGVPKAT
jgi:signal transduction histidine kinase